LCSNKKMTTMQLKLTQTYKGSLNINRYHGPIVPQQSN
jgi:hypothetical protein